MDVYRTSMNCSYCSDTAKGYDDEGEPTCGSESCSPVVREGVVESDADHNEEDCFYCSDRAVGVDDERNPSCGQCSPIDEDEYYG